MNLFYLDRDPQKAASYHIDKHVVKMPTEAAQVLSTTHRLLDGTAVVVDGIMKTWKDETQIFKKKKAVLKLDYEDLVAKDGKTFLRASMYMVTHQNHPVSAWTRHSIPNYNLHLDFYVYLLDEYEYRYGKTHGSGLIRDKLFNPPKRLTNKESTPVALCMPNEFKSDDLVESYRQFYMGKKKDFATWKKRDKPDWWIDK